MRIIMPICPHCKEELRIKISAQIISEYDDKMEEVYTNYINKSPMMPRGLRKFMVGMLPIGRRYPMLGMILSCAKCDSVISIQTQNQGRK